MKIKSRILQKRRAQMKIQEMAFVLVAIMIFFGMIVLVYFSVRLSSLKESALAQREEAAKEVVKKLADIPEYSWAGCTGCVDFDKIMAIKGKKVYDRFWSVDYMMVEKVYPNATTRECTLANYPDCTTLTLINNTANYGTVSTAFVALCSYDAVKEYERCELGKIHAAGKTI